MHAILKTGMCVFNFPVRVGTYQYQDNLHFIHIDFPTHPFSNCSDFCNDLLASFLFFFSIFYFICLILENIKTKIHLKNLILYQGSKPFCPFPLTENTLKGKKNIYIYLIVI